jgi:PPOX class probable F420-dependent enzyme
MNTTQMRPSQLAFIAQQPVGRLATADRHGYPHVVPVCYVYENAAFFIAIDEKPKTTIRPKRLRNIAENPQVALVIDVYHADWSQLAWLMVQGQAKVWEQGAEQPESLAALRQKYPQYRDMALEQRPLIQIMAERILSWGIGAETTLRSD